jgi:asparagine synthase (glutamine-hydrolysing)
MCGICGILNTNGAPVDESPIRNMVRAIIHRGPDGNAVHLDDCAALGHCRLAILDLSDMAAQPMRTADGLYAIVYNGELYNFQELRTELRRRGHVFRTRSDTEVVLRAYIQWGSKCVSRFNGMFAFAVLDKVRKRIFLARDRYGIKPLYYTSLGPTFLFASESKAFLHHPAFTPSLDLEALVEYFTFQNIFSDRTFFKGVHIFPAGCHASLPLHGPAELHPVRYWDYNFEEDPTITDERACQEELDRLFTQAVSRQLVSDVDVGAYLSGGMDSGSITALAARSMPYIKSFTCGFDLHSASGLELGFDERNAAELMSYLFKTEHYEMVLKAGDMERVLPAVIWHIEEPRVGQSYPNYCVANLASRFVKVCLAGTGGDELFAGYPWRYYRTVGAKNFDDYIDRYYLFWQRLVPNSALQRVFRPIWDKVSHVWTRDIFRDVFHDRVTPPKTPEACINRSLYFEAKTFLHGLLLVEDKLSMAHGLETRVPFLDNDLVDFAQRVPVRFKLNRLDEVARVSENAPDKMKQYYLKNNDGKQILRCTMERYIPPSVTDALKQGFSAPDASWFKGESIEYVRRILHGKNTRLYDYMAREAVDGLVNEHLQGKTNRRLFIWSLIAFELWLRSYLA